MIFYLKEKNKKIVELKADLKIIVKKSPKL